MPVVSLETYRRLRARDRDVAMDIATISDERAAELAANMQWAAHCARILYDTQARELRKYGIDPSPILGDRP